MLLIVISQTVMYAVSIWTSEFSSVGPNGRIGLFVKQADAAFWLCTAESNFIFSYFILYNYYIYRLNFIVKLLYSLTSHV